MCCYVQLLCVSTSTLYPVPPCKNYVQIYFIGCLCFHGNHLETMATVWTEPNVFSKLLHSSSLPLCFFSLQCWCKTMDCLRLCPHARQFIGVPPSRMERLENIVIPTPVHLLMLVPEMYFLLLYHRCSSTASNGIEIQLQLVILRQKLHYVCIRITETVGRKK